MHNFILGFLGMFAGFLPQVSLAQLDLEALLVEPETAVEETTAAAAVAEEKAAPTAEAEPEIAPAAENPEEEPAENAEIIEEVVAVEEVTAEKSEAAAENSVTAEEVPEIVTEEKAAAVEVIATETVEPQAETPQPEKAKIAEDDFMAQYIDEVSEREQENSQAEEVRNNAMKLIMQKDNTAVFSDDDARELFEKSARIREEQKKLLQKSSAAETATENKTETAAEDSENKEDEQAAAPTPATEIDNSAPFGLTWGMSAEEAKDAGFELQSVNAEGYTNIFILQNPQQKRTVFDKVTAVFGVQNHLQMIFAQTPPQEDTPRADKALRLYHDYYAALEQKYGNAKQHYNPNKENSTSLQEVGYDLFLQDLTEEKAFLFATFSNNALKITLSVLADSESRTYITLDYENTQVEEQDKAENLNELINDL